MAENLQTTDDKKIITCQKSKVLTVPPSINLFIYAQSLKNKSVCDVIFHSAQREFYFRSSRASVQLQTVQREVMYELF